MSSTASLPIGRWLRQHTFQSADGEHNVASRPLTKDRSLTEMIDYVVRKHHRYLRRELPAVQAVLDRTTVANGGAHPELLEVSRVFEALRAEVTTQLIKEEQVLFPSIQLLEQQPECSCGLYLEDALWVIENEHRRALEALSRLRWLTGGYVTPRDGGPLYARLMSQFCELEADLQVHVEFECHVLFPAAGRLAEKRQDEDRAGAPTVPLDERW
jgi:regulator of cell morphogenesis and NO signaling